MPPSSLRSDRLSLSERNASAELAAARGNCHAAVHIRAAGRAVNHSKVAASQRVTGGGEAWVVKDVDPIRSQLQGNSFPEAKILGQGHVENGQARAGQRVSAVITECSRCWERVRRGIEKRNGPGR